MCLLSGSRFSKQARPCCRDEARCLERRAATGTARVPAPTGSGRIVLQCVGVFGASVQVPTKVPFIPRRRGALVRAAPRLSRAWRVGSGLFGCRWGVGSCLVEHHLHAEDAEQFQQPRRCSRRRSCESGGGGVLAFPALRLGCGLSEAQETWLHGVSVGTPDEPCIAASSSNSRDAMAMRCSAGSDAATY